MIGSIGPLGQADKNKVYISSALFLIGSLIGSICFGIFWGAVGFLIRWTANLNSEIYHKPACILVGILAILSGLLDLKIIRLAMPQIMCQVPREWLNVYGPYRTSFQWALNIGAGIKTVFTYWLFYLIAVYVIIVGSPVFGARVYGTFGLTYGLVSALSMNLYRWEPFRTAFSDFLPTKNLTNYTVGIAQIVAGILLLFDKGF